MSSSGWRYNSNNWLPAATPELRHDVPVPEAKMNTRTLH
jgi:hypothetical protein